MSRSAPYKHTAHGLSIISSQTLDNKYKITLLANALHVPHPDTLAQTVQTREHHAPPRPCSPARHVHPLDRTSSHFHVPSLKPKHAQMQKPLIVSPHLEFQTDHLILADSASIAERTLLCHHIKWIPIFSMYITAFLQPQSIHSLGPPASLPRFDNCHNPYPVLQTLVSITRAHIDAPRTRRTSLPPPRVNTSGHLIDARHMPWRGFSRCNVSWRAHSSF